MHSMSICSFQPGIRMWEERLQLFFCTSIRKQKILSGIFLIQRPGVTFALTLVLRSSKHRRRRKEKKEEEKSNFWGYLKNKNMSFLTGAAQYSVAHIFMGSWFVALLATVPSLGHLEVKHRLLPKWTILNDIGHWWVMRSKLGLHCHFFLLDPTLISILISWPAMT